MHAEEFNLVLGKERAAHLQVVWSAYALTVPRIVPLPEPGKVVLQVHSYGRHYLWTLKLQTGFEDGMRNVGWDWRIDSAARNLRMYRLYHWTKHFFVSSDE